MEMLKEKLSRVGRKKTNPAGPWLGGRVHAWRAYKGLGIGEFCQALSEAGKFIHYQTVYNWSRGGNPEQHSLPFIAKALDVTIDEIYAGPPQDETGG